eukprot:TRINITY_DN2832_c7_g1::TRINITY_DN2832_c7_g1_i1::g.5316::m.5316 TRINITY_DN2832_c7_g1::TRINITY_DN2832_c7_g1_i1::g.5316  ORF type:complete len:214 (+),score=2.76,sp/Q5UPG5/YL093_MIMIV/33.59/4e-08,Ank_4/PF13637.1/0.29,Ank_4/PF13637.1/6.1e-07,Ank_4/PF13637.1/2.8e-08,Ank_4/PF13637.1/0.035,Ank/PF00023.25/3.2,Ank/PF00023.25/4e-05,Ank/PF00023.25/0.015,Ank/PF00023.25/9.1e+02,Ank/PF00023.25/1.3e+04,Ank_2/PF12796.2/1.7e-08,Ank_2/PF12796.2/0.068,Ank_3/PF13606.1/2.9,Ank_3/PF13606.1/5.3e-05,Ank_3/PF13606.1/0.29
MPVASPTSPISFLLDPLDTRQKQKYILSQDSYGSTALYEACSHVNVAAARLLVDSLDVRQKRPYILQQDLYGFTALMEACRFGSTELVRFLLDSLDPELRQPYILQKDEIGRTAMMRACASGHEKTTQLLLDYLDKSHRYQYILLQENPSSTSALSWSFYHPTILRLLLDQLSLADDITPNQNQQVTLQHEFSYFLQNQASPRYVVQLLHLLS